MTEIRHDWTRDEVRAIYNTPLLELIHRAATTHRAVHATGEVQVCSLLSVKTGGCPEDCGYCPQSARHDTFVKSEPLMPVDEVLERARDAKSRGATRFCMGAAWRRVRGNAKDFDRVLDMVRGVRGLDMEVCATLGMLDADQAARLKEAGLTAYNHNLDSSEEYYDKVVTTRTYRDRLDTLETVARAGISVCCGGILGMGESHEDRVGLLHTLATLTPHPESVPVNALVPVEGTPMAGRETVDSFQMARVIATARLLMPASVVRLSAGRTEMSRSDQALCFMAGANSIFAGDRLLTTPNPEADVDRALFRDLGLTPRPAFKKARETDAHAFAGDGAGDGSESVASSAPSGSVGARAGSRPAAGAAA